MNQSEGIKIVIAGDLLPSGKNIAVFEQGDALKLYGREVSNLFKNADYSIINLEGPLTDFEEKQEKIGPILKAPVSTIKGIQSLGVNAVALANNHITDYRQKGMDDTISLLRQSGIDFLGIGYLGGVKSHLSVRLKDRDICIYNVSETFFNTPSRQEMGANLYDEWIVLNEIEKLKQSHDYLIVIYHGGAEEFPYPTPFVRKRFHRMVDCGADFITAQHTHCIGCEEWYKGAYLLYGQGNFLFARMKNPITKEGLVTCISIPPKGSIAIKHHVVKLNKNECLMYDEAQDLAEFKYRSGKILDESFLSDRYVNFAYNAPKIKIRGLRCLRGRTIGKALLRRISKKLYYQYLENYSVSQLRGTMILLSGERYNEDFLACLNYMLRNGKE